MTVYEMLSETILCRIAAAKPAKRYAVHLAASADRYGIDTPRRVAAFMGQVLVESGGLIAVEENLNYRPETLLRTFPRYVRDIADARSLCAQGPEAIANRVYAGRMGNTRPGDGWRNRGMGLIQLTGRHNRELFAESTGIDVFADPEYLMTPEGAALSAAWYFAEVGQCIADADDWDIDEVSYRVNVGGDLSDANAARRESQLSALHGRNQRWKLSDAYLSLLGAMPCHQ